MPVLDALSRRPPALWQPGTTWWRIALVALAYLLAAKLGLLLNYAGAHATLIWLPTGIAVAALWRWGPPMRLGARAGSPTM